MLRLLGLMQNRKAILILIARPAYETLLMHEGINRLREYFKIDLLCLTFTAASDLGKELLSVASSQGFNVFFQNSTDNGPNSLLLDVDKKLSSVLKRSHYHAVITHPPHGGENAHPYQIQCFHVARRLCAELKIPFGFFSDKKVESVEVDTNLYKLGMRCQLSLLASYFKCHLKIRKYPLKNCSEILSELKYFLKTLFRRRKYTLFSFHPNMFEKQSTLDKYRTQLNSLIKFKSYINSVEYLYLERYPNTNLEIPPIES